MPFFFLGLNACEGIMEVEREVSDRVAWSGVGRS